MVEGEEVGKGAIVLVGAPPIGMEGTGDGNMLRGADMVGAGVMVGEGDEPDKLTRRRARNRCVVVGQLPPRW